MPLRVNLGLERTGEPYVHIAGPQNNEMHPEETRNFALTLMDFAAEAEYMAAIWAFSQEKLGYDRKKAFDLVKDFQEWKHKHDLLQITGGAKA